MPGLEDNVMLEVLNWKLYCDVTILHVVDERINTLPISLVLVEEGFEVSLLEVHGYQVSIKVILPFKTLQACIVIHFNAIIFKVYA